MPIHDWSRVEAGLFHHFHTLWTGEICAVLNEGLLPDGFSALVEQRAGGVVPDVLALERRTAGTPPRKRLATLPKPKASLVFEAKAYHRKANRIAIRHRLGEVVCILEIVSPGSKAATKHFQEFVGKIVEFLDRGVNIVVIDLFPPTPRDPLGVHRAIWDALSEEPVPFEPPVDRPLTLAAYTPERPYAFSSTTAYVEPVAVGMAPPDVPAYLDDDFFVPVPLEQTYAAAWRRCPADLRHLVEHGKLPGE